MSEKITLHDLIREFNRGNFYHVNDTDEMKSYSDKACRETCNYLESYEALKSQNAELIAAIKTNARNDKWAIEILRKIKGELE